MKCGRGSTSHNCILFIALSFVFFAIARHITMLPLVCIALLAAVAAQQTHGTPFSSWYNVTHSFRSIGAFIIVLVAAYPLGFIFPKYFKLPLITGYLFIGILAGPYLTDLLTVQSVHLLAHATNSLALAFISCQAGQEIYLPELKPQLRGILQLLMTRFAMIVVIVTSVLLVSSRMFFYGSMEGTCQLAIAFLFGSIAVLVSPSTIMAIKVELHSNGRFTNLMMGAVMMSEFVVLVAFSIARLMSSVYCAKLSVTFVNVLFTSGIIVSNLIVGGGIGVIFIGLFLLPGKEKHGAHTVHFSLYVKGFFWLVFSHAIYITTTTLSEYTIIQYGHNWDVKFEPILVLMIGSCIAGHYGHIRHDMHVILDAAAPYIFLPFFVMTGAALKLDQVVMVIPLTSFYVVLRYIANFISCYTCGRFMLKLPRHQYLNLWLTMSPQAGVTLGLASEIQAMSSDPWTNEFATTLIATVIVNQIFGPVFCSMGLRNAGECGKGGKSERVSLAHSSTFDSMMPTPKASTTQLAVVFGDDDTAYQVAFHLFCQGIHVSVPFLDAERANELSELQKSFRRTSTHPELPLYKKENMRFLESLRSETEFLQHVTTKADVAIFTGCREKSLESIQSIRSSTSDTLFRIVAILSNESDTEAFQRLNVQTVSQMAALCHAVTELVQAAYEDAASFSKQLQVTATRVNSLHSYRQPVELNANLCGQYSMFGRMSANARPFANEGQSGSAYDYYVCSRVALDASRVREDSVIEMDRMQSEGNGQQSDFSLLRL